jgi:Bacterial membrane protein YfhO
VLALLAGLSLSAQWRARAEPRGRQLRQLALLGALCAAAALSVATSVTGPLDPFLAAPVGVLALGLILYFALAESRSPVVAHVFLLPLVASFLLQPWGRHAWAGAPTASELAQGTATREAVDRAMGSRRDERALTLAESRPSPESAADLAWANLATFAGRRNVNGYDPLVPAGRRSVFEGMRADGTVPRALLESDPGRLELLGVRWLQVPTAALAAAPDADGLGDEIDVVVEEPRPHLFAVPFTRTTEVRIVSFLAGAAAVEQGRIVAECVARLADGHEIWVPIRAGVDTAEWAWERPDVREVVRHQKPEIYRSYPAGEGFSAHQYRGVLRLPGRFAVTALRFRAWPGAPALWLLRAGLHDAQSGRSVGISIASAYTSDEVRLALAAGTPRVSLYEVRRGIGPAWVVSSLRRLPDDARLLDVLHSPTRLGVDARAEALATEADAAGLVLPPGSRASPADVARAVGGRIVVRAAGPGLLLVAEGYDPGWSARVDGAPAAVRRVNGDRIGLVLAEGTHRVVLTYRTRGLAAGCALAVAGLALLVASFWRQRARRRLTALDGPC